MSVTPKHHPVWYEVVGVVAVEEDRHVGVVVEEVRHVGVVTVAQGGRRPARIGPIAGTTVSVTHSQHKVVGFITVAKRRRPALVGLLRVVVVITTLSATRTGGGTPHNFGSYGIVGIIGFDVR
jgi:hypothetical protein